MNGKDQRQAVVLFEQDPAEVRIPGVHVDEIGIRPGRGHGIVALCCREDRTQIRRATETGFVGAETAHRGIAIADLLMTEAAHLDVHQAGQRPRQIFHMNPGPAINVRRVFVGEKQGFHGSILRRGGFI